MNRSRPWERPNSTSRPWPRRSGLIVVSRGDGHVLSSADESKIAGLAKTLTAQHIPAVASVTTSPSYLSENKKVQLVQVVFKGQAGDPGPNAAVPLVRAQTDAYLAGSGLRGQLTGNAAISVDSTTAYEKAETIIAIATVVLILALLGLVFRSPVIAVLPIVIIGAVHEVAQSITATLADWLGFQVGPELAPLLLGRDVRGGHRLHRLPLVPPSRARRPGRARLPGSGHLGQSGGRRDRLGGRHRDRGFRGAAWWQAWSPCVPSPPA